MGGFGGQPKPPGMGQQGLPSDIMQRLQQFQQMMQGRSGIGPTGQPLGEEGFGPAGQLPTPQQFQQQQLGGMPSMGQGQQALQQGMQQQQQLQQAMQQQQQLQAMQSNPMQQPQMGGMPQQAPMQSNPMQQPQMGGMGMGQQLGGMPQQAPMQSNPMQQQVMRPPAMPQAANRQQVGFESPRMQAMRNMQRRGGSNR
jgi:hypothetical protein